MKTLRSTIAYVGAALVTMTLAFAARGFSDQTVALDDLPAAVRATIEENSAGGTIVEVETDQKNGQVVYEAEVLLNGKETDIVVSVGGTLLAIEAEDDEDEDNDEGQEQTIAWDQLPVAVQQTLRETVPGVPIGELVRETEDGFVIYELEYESDGARRTIELTESGEILETEEIVDSNTLPAALLSRLQAKIPGATVTEAAHVSVRYYELEIELNGTRQEVILLANGRALADDEDDDEDDDDDEGGDNDDDDDEGDDD